MTLTRIIVVGAWLPAAASVAAQVPPPMPVAPQQFQLLFDTDSSVPIPALRDLIPDMLAAHLASVDDVGILLLGHADRVGTRAHNLALSCRRARWVRDALVVRGVRRDRIVLSAYGEDRPVIDTVDGMAEMANRRVETIITPGWREGSAGYRQGQEGC